MFHNNHYQREVTEALLDRWNLDSAYLRSYDNYRRTSQELSLCGERYLSDELINFLGKKYCDKANEEGQICQNVLLPSYFSSGTIFSSVVENICHHNDMRNVKNMFYACPHSAQSLGTCHILDDGPNSIF